MNEQKKDKQKNQEKNNEADLKGGLSQLETILDEYMVKKAPFALPKDVKEFIVKISPYLVIIFALIFLPILFSVLGLSAIFGPFAMMGRFGYGIGLGYGAVVSLVAGFIALIMEIVAVPGLFKRTKSSWRLVFYASIVSFIGSVLSIHGIFGGIIGIIIGWYILFQVKDLYKN